MPRLLRITLLVVASFAAVTSSAVAGKGAGGGGTPTAPTAWVSASPNPAPAGGARVELTGCGFNLNYSAEVRVVHSAGYTETYGVAVWYTGCLNVTPITTREAGTYTVQVYQRQAQERKGLVLRASTVLSVG